MAREYFVVPVDLRCCGPPDTTGTLSRSNLIGRPQRLRATLHRIGQCVYTAREIAPSFSSPDPDSLTPRFVLHAPSPGPDLPGCFYRQCCSIGYCSHRGIRPHARPRLATLPQLAPSSTLRRGAARLCLQVIGFAGEQVSLYRRMSLHCASTFILALGDDSRPFGGSASIR